MEELSRIGFRSELTDRCAHRIQEFRQECVEPILQRIGTDALQNEAQQQGDERTLQDLITSAKLEVNELWKTKGANARGPQIAYSANGERLTSLREAVLVSLICVLNNHRALWLSPTVPRWRSWIFCNVSASPYSCKSCTPQTIRRCRGIQCA